MTNDGRVIPSCTGLWWLFDSTNPADHIEARRLCGACPMRTECAQTAARYQRGTGGAAMLVGTWAGQLYGSTARFRMRAEDAMFTDEEARIAHAQWMRTPRSERTRMGVGDRVMIGERVYQRRCKRRVAAARKARAA